LSIDQPAGQCPASAATCRRLTSSAVQQLADAALAKLTAHGPPADLMRDFAGPLAAGTLSKLLGVGLAERPGFEDMITDVNALFPPTTSLTPPNADRSSLRSSPAEPHTGTPQLRGRAHGRVSRMTRPVEIPAQGPMWDAAGARWRLESPTFTWHER
jgi:hypothetical protein